MATVMDGIIIGGAGGAIAGITVYLIQFIHTKIADHIESRKIYMWLKTNTRNERGHRFRTTRAIASWNNQTLDRVRYLCSFHEEIYLSTGNSEDVWSVYLRCDEDPRIR